MSSRFQSAFLSLTLQRHGPRGRGFNLWQTSFPNNSAGLCTERTGPLFRSIWDGFVQNTVQQCARTTTSLSKDSFIKFRGRRVLKCCSTCTASTGWPENLTLFSGNCPWWEHIKRNNGYSVFRWNQNVLSAPGSVLSEWENLQAVKCSNLRN